jgi:hypothetical protein
MSLYYLGSWIEYLGSLTLSLVLFSAVFYPPQPPFGGFSWEKGSLECHVISSLVLVPIPLYVAISLEAQGIENQDFFDLLRS